jgi:peptidoglycan/LPS O-acetylase OafA/YrhL
MPEKVNSSGGNTNILYSYLLFPSDDKFLIQNGWTLSFEFLFYFVFSSCLLIKSTYRFLLPFSIIVFLVVIGRLVMSESPQILFLTKPLLLEFLFGMSAYYFSQNIKKNKVVGGG